MRDGAPSGPLLFLSHAGADTGAARALKQRIEQAPEARKRGLKVWFDKDNLRAGESWQKQLEDAIGQQATAFAVYVGSRGVINWVEAEVRLGLSRAIGGNGQHFPSPNAKRFVVALLVSAITEGGSKRVTTPARPRIDVSRGPFNFWKTTPYKVVFRVRFMCPKTRRNWPSPSNCKIPSGVELPPKQPS